MIGAIAGAVRDGARVVRILRGSVKAVSLADFVRAQLPADVQVEALAEVPAVPAPDAAREETSAYVLVPREGDDLSSMLRHFLDWRGGWLIGPETARFHARSPLFLVSVPKSGTSFLYQLVRQLGYRDGVELLGYAESGRVHAPVPPGPRSFAGAR